MTNSHFPIPSFIHAKSSFAREHDIFKKCSFCSFPAILRDVIPKANLCVLLCLAPVHCINFKILPSLPQTHPWKTCFALEIDLSPSPLLLPSRKLIGWDSRVETRKNSKGKKQQQRREKHMGEGEKNNVFVVLMWAISVGKIVLSLFQKFCQFLNVGVAAC